MRGIYIKHKGTFDRTEKWLKKMEKWSIPLILEKYALQGVAALKAATPKDSGVTASSWYYSIERKRGKATINFCNSNVENGFKVAVFLQYGHASKNGYWVQGKDYINSSLAPIFDAIAEEAWKEVTE